MDAKLGRARLGSHQDLRIGRRIAQRVLEEVREHALDLRRVDLDERGLRTDIERHATRVRAETGERLADELVDVPQLAMRLGGAGLETREVEQLLDDAVETRRLVANRLREPEPVLRRAAPGRGLASASADARIAVSGERRSCETERRSAVFSASLRRSASASSTSSASRSRSSVSLRNATSAASASSARRRERLASSLTTTAVTTKTSSANQFFVSWIVNV